MRTLVRERWHSRRRNTLPRAQRGESPFRVLLQIIVISGAVGAAYWMWGGRALWAAGGMVVLVAVLALVAYARSSAKTHKAAQGMRGIVEQHARENGWVLDACVDCSAAEGKGHAMTPVLLGLAESAGKLIRAQNGRAHSLELSALGDWRIRDSPAGGCDFSYLGPDGERTSVTIESKADAARLAEAIGRAEESAP
jgi:hypothetical protein